MLIGVGVGGFFGAALGATVGETGLVGLEFELFGTDRADFDGEGHSRFILMRRAPGCEWGRRFRPSLADGGYNRDPIRGFDYVDR